MVAIDLASTFERTTCACKACRECCRRPGCLAPGDVERILSHLGEPPAAAKLYFVASPGALVLDRVTNELFRIGTITPRRVKGRCVFLDAEERCQIHTVSPFGCSHFDLHMDDREGQRRSNALARAQLDPEYQTLRSTLPFA